MAERPELRALARQLGVIDSYRKAGATGRCRHTTDTTREALLAAMGVDASSEQLAAAALANLGDEEHGRLLAPVRVVYEGTPGAGAIALDAPPDVTSHPSWQIEASFENGRSDRFEGRAEQPDTKGGLLWIRLPSALPNGYHRIRITLEASGSLREAEQLLIVAPRSCTPVSQVLEGERAIGLTANLYSLCGRQSWGAGDFGDLRRLVELADDRNASFVGINPLHALWNRGQEISPYEPISRLYRNALYLEVEDIPEFQECRAAGRQIEPPGGEPTLAALRRRRQIDYAGVMAAKRPVLEQLHHHFATRHRDRATPRARAYSAYLAYEGEPLEQFATFLALAEHFSTGGPARCNWHDWPIEYRSPNSEKVVCFRRDHSEAIDFHRWVQFELDRQLAAVAQDARIRELSIGLYSDLAVGSAGSGSDTWAFPGLFAEGATAGAPPDDFAVEGQSWGFPPPDPRQLREHAYEYWIRSLRAGFAHAGALRIDHVMGLSRLYWVPRGRPATEGAYVRYPEHDLMGILALESRRHGALVIGEDLGTVPRSFADDLAEWGILSSQVLYFECKDGDFQTPGSYSDRALVSANTHDLPPLAGFLNGTDLDLRRRAGQISSDEVLAEARRERACSLQALLRRLASEGLLDCNGAPLPIEHFAAAVYAFLGRTPAPLLAVSLDDLVGEAEPINLPGVPADRHASWTRPLGVELDTLTTHPVAQAIFEALKL